MGECHAESGSHPSAGPGLCMGSVGKDFPLEPSRRIHHRLSRRGTAHRACLGGLRGGYSGCGSRDWGFFLGSDQGRFSDFAYSPAEALAYLRDMIASRAKRYFGHSPGGAAMVFAVLILLAATVVTGLIVYGGEQQAGPLAGMFSKDTGEAVEEAHEVFANITLALVFFHLVGVALASFGHHENLVRAMITGYKRP